MADWLVVTAKTSGINYQGGLQTYDWDGASTFTAKNPNAVSPAVNTPTRCYDVGNYIYIRDAGTDVTQGGATQPRWLRIRKGAPAFLESYQPPKVWSKAEQFYPSSSIVWSASIGGYTFITQEFGPQTPSILETLFVNWTSYDGGASWTTPQAGAVGGASGSYAWSDFYTDSSRTFTKGGTDLRWSSALQYDTGSGWTASTVNSSEYLLGAPTHIIVVGDFFVVSYNAHLWYSADGITFSYAGQPAGEFNPINYVAYNSVAGVYAVAASGGALYTTADFSSFNAISNPFEFHNVVGVFYTGSGVAPVYEGELSFLVRLDTNTGALASRVVYLYEQESGAIVDTKTSATGTGSVTFTGLDPEKLYFAVGKPSTPTRRFDVLGWMQPAVP